MDNFGLYRNRKSNLLLFIILILSICFILFSLLIIDSIKDLRELMFFKQFVILSILYLIILPTLMVIISNIYFNIIQKKEWHSWLKIPEYYDDLFRIISLFPCIFLMFEISMFLGFYTKIIELNEIILIIILCPIFGLLFVYSHIIIKKIYSIK